MMLPRWPRYEASEENFLAGGHDTSNCHSQECHQLVKPEYHVWYIWLGCCCCCFVGKCTYHHVIRLDSSTVAKSGSGLSFQILSLEPRAGFEPMARVHAILPPHQFLVRISLMGVRKWKVVGSRPRGEKQLKHWKADGPSSVAQGDSEFSNI